jgi:hypothetical protein
VQRATLLRSAGTHEDDPERWTPDQQRTFGVARSAILSALRCIRGTKPDVERAPLTKRQ